MAQSTDEADDFDPREDGGALARWGAACAVMSLVGLFMAANAGDQYYFVTGMGFAAFGLFLGTRLLARWRP